MRGAVLCLLSILALCGITCETAAANAPGDIYDHINEEYLPANRIWMEVGFFSISEEWARVETTYLNFTDPVVFLSLPNLRNASSVALRVNNTHLDYIGNGLKRFSFDARSYGVQDEYCDLTYYTPGELTVASSFVGWLVVERGMFNVSHHAFIVSADTINRTSSDAEEDHRNQFKSFAPLGACGGKNCRLNSAAAYLSIAQLQTTRFDRFLLLRGFSREHNFVVYILTPHDSAQVANHFIPDPGEVYAWMLFETGLAVTCTENLVMETKLYNVNFQAISVSFANMFSFPPFLFGMINTLNGRDSLGLRAFDVTATSADFITQEDKCLDQETSHVVTEETSVLIIGQANVGTTRCGAAYDVSFRSVVPTGVPTTAPTTIPSGAPTEPPAGMPTSRPTVIPTVAPTHNPTGLPSSLPSGDPTASPSGHPSTPPSGIPTGYPTAAPTTLPTALPTGHPTSSPTGIPTPSPTPTPTGLPSGRPSGEPTAYPTSSPSTSVIAKLVASSSIYAPCDSVFLDPTYSTGSSAGKWGSVVWSVASDDSSAEEIEDYLNSNFGNSTATVAEIPDSLTEIGVFRVTMFLTSTTGMTGRDSVILTIASDGDEYPKVAIPGGDVFILPRYPLVLFANTSVSTCNLSAGASDKSLLYQWELRDADGNLMDLSSSSKNPRYFKLGGFSLSSGLTYRATVFVQYGLTGKVSSSSVLVVIGSEGVRSVIGGGVSWDVAANGEVIVDGSQSRNLDAANGVLIFRLSCVELIPRLGRRCGGVFNESYTNPIRTIPTSILVPDLIVGQSYVLLFTLNVSSALNPMLFDATTANVSVLPAEFSVPVFSFLNIQTSYQSDKDVAIACNISIPYGFTATWSSESLDLLSLNPQTPLTKSFSVGRYTFYLSLPPGALEASVLYTLRLSVSPFGNSLVAGSASVVVRAHIPPADGIFSVNPSFGVAYNSTFYFQTSSWSFDTDGLPAAYSFEYYVTSPNEKTVMCAYDILNSCSSVLPEGSSTANSSLVVISSVRDAIGSSSELQRLVTVTGFKGDISALGAVINTSFAAAFESFDSNLIYQVVKVAADTLNVRNCSDSPNCLELNRELCRSVDNTCGKCLEGYVGVNGPSNSPCESAESGMAKKVGSACLLNSDCLSQRCDASTGLCISAVKVCPNNCSSNGVCVYHGVGGDLLDECLSSNLYCVAKCSCRTGYFGKTCSFLRYEMEDRQRILNTMCEDYESSKDLDDITADILYRRAVMVTTILNDYEENGYYFNKCFLSFYDAFSQIERLDNSGPLVESVLTALSTISLHANKNELSEISSAVYNMSRLTAQYSIADQIPGAAEKVFISELISFSSAELYSFEISDVMLKQPLRESDIALGAPQDNVVIAAEDNPLFDVTGYAVVVHYNNPSGGAVNYSMLEVESHFVEESNDSSPGLSRRRLVSTVSPVQNYTTTVQRLHDGLAADVATAGTVLCNQSTSAYNVSVYCPASALTGPQNFSLICSGEFDELHSYSCPSSADVATCQQWNGYDFLPDPPCKAVSLTDSNLTCHCIAPIVIYDENNNVLQSFVRGYTGSVSKVATSFGSTIVSVQDVNTDTILKNIVVFATMLGLLVLLFFGFFLLYSHDVAVYTSEVPYGVTNDGARTISSFFDEVIPPQFDDKKWYTRLWTDLVAEHSIISIFVKASPTDFRSVKWILALCSVVNFMFVDTVLAILFFADDGSCEEYVNEVECETDRSLNLQETVCEWDMNKGTCSFREPSDSFLSTIVLALVITVAVVPLDFFVSYLVHYGRLYFLVVADRIKHQMRNKSDKERIVKETVGRGDVSTTSYSELRLVLDRQAIFLISARLYRLRSEINVNPFREVCFMLHAWGGWDVKLLSLYETTFKNPTAGQIIRGRVAEGRCYMQGLPQVLNDFHKSMAGNKRVDADSLSPAEEDVLTVVYYMLERLVMVARTRSKNLLAQIDDIENEEAKQVYLMKKFIVDSVSGICRRVASRYFFGIGSSDEDDKEISTPSWFETLCLLLLVIYICFLCLFIFLFGASIGSRATNQWLMGVFVALFQAFFVLEPMSILFYNILFAGVAYYDIMRICKRLRNRAKYIMLRPHMKLSMRHTFLHHLNPASKVACKVSDLPVSRLLLCVNDLDLPTRYDHSDLGATVSGFAVAFIIVIFTSLPEIVQSNLMEIFVCSGFNFIILGFYIAYLSLSFIQTVLLGAAVVFALSFMIYLDLRKTCKRGGHNASASGEESTGKDIELVSSKEEQCIPATLQAPAVPVDILTPVVHLSIDSRQSSKRLVLSYVVVRHAGAYMKKEPIRDSVTVNRYKKGANVSIDAIIKNKNQEQWLGNDQGWIPATTAGGQNVLLPGSTLAPVSARIVGTSFIEKKKGRLWTTLIDNVEMLFELEFGFSCGGSIRIFRTYSAVLELQGKVLRDRSRNFEVSQLPHHLNFDVVADLDELFHFDIVVSTWISNVFCTGKVSGIVADFLLPTENDIEKMEAELERNTSFSSSKEILDSGAVL